MSRAPSAETQLKALRRELKTAKANLALLDIRANLFRARATQAEQEVADWHRRFDALLARTSTVSCEPKNG